MRKGIERLRRRLRELEDFRPEAVSKRFGPEVKALESSIEESLEQTFGRESTDFERYSGATNLDYGSLFIGRSASLHEVHEYLRDGRERALALLRQAVKGLEERLLDVEPAQTSTGRAPETKSLPNQVFVVHGHENGIRESVARFLEKVGLEPIILHEQPNRGDTLIEKFEKHGAMAGFAVILLTGDDVGGLNASSLRPRARQNVVLELGYFLGLLGRDRVCAMVQEGVELPSDILGIAWTSLSGGWKMELAKELEAVGYNVDWNKVIKA